MIDNATFRAAYYPFPSDDIDPKLKKEKAYCLAFAKAFYWYYLRGDLYTSFGGRTEMLENRAYGRGRQPNDLYFELCYGRYSEGHEKAGQIIRKGWMNVDWRIFKVAVKYRNAFLGIFSDIDFDINANSLDASSRKELNEKKYQKWAQSQLKIGNSQDDIPDPTVFAELELLESMGAFKLKVEYAYEKSVNSSFDIVSQWGERVKKRVLEDLLDFSKALVKDQVNHTTQVVEVVYEDIAKSVLRRSENGDLLDGGIYKIKTAADVRAEATACGVKITEEDLRSCCRRFENQFGNSRWDNRWENGSEGYNVDGGCWYYDGWKVMVLDCEYRTLDRKYITKSTRKGEEKYYDEEYGTVKQSKNKETVIDNYINYYRCKWVVGTEICYDYGQQFDVPRPSHSEARSSFHLIDLECPSQTEVCRPIFDQVQLAWLKLQDAQAKSTPTLRAYDFDAITNVVIGGKMKPLEHIKMGEQSGRMFFRSTTMRGARTSNPNSGLPIQQFPGGAAEAYNEFAIAWNLLVNMIQELSGMTPQASASPLPSDTGKAVSEIQIQATSNVLKPIIQGYGKLKQETAYTMLLRLMLVFRHNEKIAKKYYDILGEEIVEVLKAAADKTPTQIGVKLVPRTNAALRAKLENAATEAMRAGQITISQYNFIVRMLDQSANPRYVDAMLARMIAENKRIEEESAMARIDKQNEGIAKAAAITKKSEEELDMAKSNNKIREIVSQGYVDVFVENNKVSLNSAAAGEEMVMSALTESMMAGLNPLMEQVSQTLNQPATV